MTLSLRSAALSTAVVGVVATGALALAHGELGAGSKSTQSKVPQKRVSVSFNNAPLGDVLEWLRKEDAEFVVASNSTPSDLRITLNAKNETLANVEDVIAQSMGGTWIKQGGMLVFQKGVFPALPLFPSANGKVLPFDGQMWKSPDGKSFEFNFKNLGNGQNLLGPEFEKRIQEQFGPEFEKKIEEQFGPGFQKRIEEQSKQRANGANPKPLAVNDQDLDGLMGSLTAEQRALMQRKGYLTPNDMTPKQRTLLGPVSGKFEIKVKSAKGDMTIKSN